MSPSKLLKRVSNKRRFALVIRWQISPPTVAWRVFHGYIGKQASRYWFRPPGDPQFYEMPSIRAQNPATTTRADHSLAVTDRQGTVRSAP